MQWREYLDFFDLLLRDAFQLSTDSSNVFLEVQQQSHRPEKMSFISSTVEDFKTKVSPRAFDDDERREKDFVRNYQFDDFERLVEKLFESIYVSLFELTTVFRSQRKQSRMYSIETKQRKTIDFRSNEQH